MDGIFGARYINFITYTDRRERERETNINQQPILFSLNATNLHFMWFRCRKKTASKIHNHRQCK